MTAPNIMERAALRKLGIADPSWGAFHFMAMEPSDVLVEVAEFRIVTKGKRKGRRSFFGHERRCVLSQADLDAERVRYETESGECADCDKGQRVTGFTQAGLTFKPCERCNGTGKPTRAAGEG